MNDETPRNDKRQRLIDAAERVFGEQGFERATVDMVAAEAGVSKGSVYNYFDSKSELFLAVFLDQLPDEHGELMDNVLTCDGAGAKVELLIDWWFANTAQSEKLNPLLLEFWLSASRHEDGMIIESLRSRYLLWREVLTNIIANGIATGEFHADQQPANTAAVLMAMFDGLILQGIMKVGVTIDQAFLDRLKQGILASLTGLAVTGNQARTDTDHD
jgi:AcrR family transcriptional regulator